MKRFPWLAVAGFLFFLTGCAATQDCSCPASATQSSVSSDDAKIINSTEKNEMTLDTKPEIPQTNDMQEVYALIKSMKTYYIATVDGDQPRVRPFGTVHIFDGKLYIQTGKKKNVAHQIEANHKIEIVAYDNQSTWIRVAAEAVEDERIEAQESMLEEYPNLKSMYTPGDGNTVVYYLKNATATISSFAAPERVIQF